MFTVTEIPTTNHYSFRVLIDQLSKEKEDLTERWESSKTALQQLMSELERRERQFNAVQEQGESLGAQNHPATKTVEAYMAAMQTQWSWLLQLTLAAYYMPSHLFIITFSIHL